MILEKYHALGNDFLITEYDSKINYGELAKRICHRNTGIGGDGLIVVRSSLFLVEFYNADGSKASMCGNGIRCAFYYLYKKKIDNEYYIKCNDYTYKIEYVSLKKDELISKVYFSKNMIEIKQMELSPTVNGIKAYSTYVGNSHLVLLENCDKMMEILDKSDTFSLKTNIDIIENAYKNTIEVVTYELGVGKTLSCGTGAVASAISYAIYKNVKYPIIVKNKLGQLEVDEEKYAYTLKGPCSYVGKVEVNI